MYMNKINMKQTIGIIGMGRFGEFMAGNYARKSICQKIRKAFIKKLLELDRI